jgi:signal transduction histidine kinase/ActR/RegA family two-component response regulator
MNSDSARSSCASRALRIDHDLSRRSMYGGLVYFGFIIALSVATDYARARPAIIVFVAAVTAACAAIRLLLGLFFERLYKYSPLLWRTLLWTAVTVAAGVWGFFLAATILWFGYYDWKTLILLICMAGTAPVALASYTPAPRLMLVYQILFCVPMILANLYGGDVTGYTMAAMFSWYLGFILMFARRLHVEYRDSLDREAIELAKREAEAANHAKSELVSHISHELRTPMNTIIGMTYLALHTPDEGERRKYLDIVQESSRFLVQLINRLLDISKIDSNKLELENTVFDLRRLVESVLAAFHAEGVLRGLELTSEIAPEAPRMVAGDEGRLRQVLVNILGNAVKFTERGGIRTTIGVSEEDDVSVALLFSVSDTGIGIPPDRQAAIFEPYEQADASTSRRFGGSGLGLAICSRLVKLMGGSIWVESKLREGSRFHWTARLRKAQSPAAVAETHVAPEPSLKPSTPLTPATGVKILVAEDNLVNQFLMQRLLQRRGHSVHVVSNGQEVLDALENEPFDLVLMDVNMPKLDGLQTAAAIRRRETESGGAVAIIALTANAQEGMREECLRVGMNGYLSKPLDPVELYKVIELCASPVAASPPFHNHK